MEDRGVTGQGWPGGVGVGVRGRWGTGCELPGGREGGWRVVWDRVQRKVESRQLPYLTVSPSTPASHCVGPSRASEKIVTQ